MQLYTLLKNEAWEKKFVCSKGLTMVLYISCSYDQISDFKAALEKPEMRYVHDVQVSPWVKTQKGGGIYLGSTGSNLCKNFEWGLRVCMGPKKKNGEDSVKPVDAHFPFLTKSEEKMEIDLMNRLRTQAFMAPHLTDNEKFKSPFDAAKTVNVYEKGLGFSEMIVSHFNYEVFCV